MPLRSTSNREVNPGSHVGNTPARSLSFKCSFSSAVRPANDGMLPEKPFPPRSSSVNAVIPFRLAGISPLNSFPPRRNTSTVPQVSGIDPVSSLLERSSNMVGPIEPPRVGILPASWLSERSRVPSTLSPGILPDNSLPDRSREAKSRRLNVAGILPSRSFPERSTVARFEGFAR